MKIIADSAIPFLRGVLEPFAEVEYLPGTAISAADVRNADALVIRTRTRCDEKLLADSRVKLIATATIGFDHIDTAWCAAHGIEVTTAAGCNARGVLQWVGATLVHLSRTQGWQPAERTLGIVGVGHVGSLVKAYAEGWGFRVVCCDPPREERERCGFRTLEEVAREADILTFHTPLDASTRHMADSRLFGLMKPGAILINTSRGEVVDGEALLRSGLGWALDVWEHEPHLDPALLENALLATPHIAGYSEQGKATPRRCPSPRWPAVSACRSKGGIRPKPLRRAGGRSPGRNFAGPSAGRTTSRPKAAASRSGPGISNPCATTTPTAANIFSTNGADCARSGVRKRRNRLFISEFALF